MTIDWDKAAAVLKREVVEHGGFLTVQKDSLRDRFGIGRLTEKISQELVDTLDQHGMMVIPNPYYVQGTSTRVYDVESEIGKIVLAVGWPQDYPERALIDVVELYERTNAGKDRRSDDIPWLSALDVFLQLVIGKPPEGWEELDDDREPFELREALAASLGLPADIVDSKETVRIAGAVCACRPHRYRLEGSPPGLGAALADAGRKQKEGFDAVLLEAAKHLLEGAEIPSRQVEMGRLGLRYRHEAKGGIGWVR
jgi:hypothetical protein